jgi:lysophospholipase L1-like esterase
LSGTGRSHDGRPFSPRYLALGDSYTIGEGVPAEESFPLQLCARLRQNGIALQDPVVLARTGWTCAELGAAVRAAPPPWTFDLVSLLVGVNNQYRGLALDSYRAELRELLDQALVFAGGDSRRVVIISIPDWGQTPFGRSAVPNWGQTLFGRPANPAIVSRQIDAFNRVKRVEASTRAARWVEITSLTRSYGQNPAWITGDGLHPSGKQYAAWVERILAEALAALSETRA